MPVWVGGSDHRPIIAEGVGLPWLTRDFDGRPMCGVLDASALTADEAREIEAKVLPGNRGSLTHYEGNDTRDLDFDDLIMRTVEIFDRFPDALQAYQERFVHVLVDEFQDTNRLQLDVLEALERDATPAPAAATGGDPPTSSSVEPPDEVLIKAPNIKELDGQKQKVRPDGKIEILAEYPYDFVLPMKKWKKRLTFSPS